MATVQTTAAAGAVAGATLEKRGGAYPLIRPTLG